MNTKARLKALEQAIGRNATPHVIIIQAGEDGSAKIAEAKALHGDNLIIVQIVIVKPNTPIG